MAWIIDKTANHEDATLDDSIVKTILTDKSYVKNGQPGNGSFVTAKGEYEIPYSELYTSSVATSIKTLPAGTYTAGQEIEFEGENFYVLEDTETSVKLFAKNSLNRAGTEQVNLNISEIGRAFSKTNYWSSTTTGNSYDLQSETMITAANPDGNVSDGVQNAVIVARDYGIAKGALTGRLMTYEEANAIINSSDQIMKQILFGTMDHAGLKARLPLLLAWFGL